MNRAFLMALCLSAAACMKPAESSALPKAVESGLDPASFDKNVRPQDDLFKHVNGYHSPSMYRANGPVRNIPEFYAAFGVKEGDKLFLPPDRRVKIW